MKVISKGSLQLLCELKRTISKLGFVLLLHKELYNVLKTEPRLFKEESSMTDVSMALYFLLNLPMLDIKENRFQRSMQNWNSLI